MILMFMDDDGLSKYKKCEFNPDCPACKAYLETKNTTPELFCWSNLYPTCILRRNMKKPKEKKPLMARGEY